MPNNFVGESNFNPDDLNIGDDFLAMDRNAETDAPPAEPKKAEAKNEDEEVPEELWPWRDQLMEWIHQENRYNDLISFLQYRKGTKHKLIGGMGFYHRPAKDIVSLSVPDYKKMVESAGMTPAQFIFGAMHEFAHLKTMSELDYAGKHNHLEQFNYEKGKGYFSRDREGRPVRLSARGTYRQFYNVLEDAIVNSMVFNTGIYGKNVTESSRKNNQEVVDLYTESFFPVYLDVGEGNGEYIYNPAETDPAKAYEKVGEGKGNIKVASKEDYETGFDWSKTIPPMPRVAQFVTFFMKNQMIGLSQRTVYDKENNPEGKHKLDEDVGMIFTRPLSEVFKTLLQRFSEKYKNDPDKLELYLRFMSDQVRVPFYKEVNGKIVKQGYDVHVNVANRGKNGPISSDYQKIDINFASLLFDKKLKESLLNLGLSADFGKVSSLTYLELFNLFKQVDNSRNFFGTKPLKYNLVTRTKVIRDVLEPIYSLLCILDDNFKAELPPEPPTGPKEPPRPPEIEEEPIWRPGDRVINDVENSPYKGRIGVITKVDGDENEIISVEVEYFEEEQNSLARALAGETDTVFDPDKNLIPYLKKGKKGKKSKYKDRRRPPVYEDDEIDDEDDDEDEDDEKDQNSDEQDNKDNADDEKKSSVEDILDSEERAIREMIEQEKQERAAKKVEEEKKSTEYQQKKSKNDKIKKLLAQLKEKSEKASDTGEKVDPPSAEMVKKYLELEELLRVPANKMAEAWLRIIRNISRKIDTIVDKYYRQGKPDIKKLQRLLPEIEFGAEVDRRLIHSLIVERIKVELKPAMIRVILLVDDSGSMMGSLDQVRMTIMLLASSLRNFRVNFQQVLGSMGTENDRGLDVVYDIEVRSFSDRTKCIMPFGIKDLSFLSDPTKTQNKPSLLSVAESEAGNLIEVFQELGKGGGTKDTLCWLEIIKEHDADPKIRELLKKGILTEIIFQITDGSIEDSESISIAGGKSNRVETLDLIRHFRENYAVATGGISIGGESAKLDLQRRHGENVRSADSANDLADEFSDFLIALIEDQIEKPIMELLENIENAL